MMMRIAIVIPYYPPYHGGAERQAQILARLISQRVQSCEVITSKYSRTLPSQWQDGKVIVRRLRTWCSGNIRLAINFCFAFLYFLMHSGRYDVIHAHCLSPFVFGSIAGAKLRGRKSLLKISTMGQHGEITKVKEHFFNMFLWYFTQLADIFITQTPMQSHELCTAGIPSTKIREIPNTVLPCEDEALDQESRNQARRSLGLPERCTVLFAGRLVKEKGIGTLLQAWAKLTADCDATLVLLTDGPERKRIAEFIFEVKWGDSVRMFGWRKDPELIFRASDILVFPSHSEGFGNVLAEAMAHGLAVVSTKVGLAQHWVQDGKSALLVDIEAPDALAETIKLLIQNESLRARLGHEAKLVTSKYFHPKAIVAKYMKLYQKLSPHKT